MSNAKTVMSQAANTWAGPTYIEDVFSTYLYTGNGSTQTITNGIDLAGEGGLVWIKWRSGSATPGANTDNIVVDTERGTSVYLETNSTSANKSATALSAFNSDGFTTGGALTDVDNSGDNFASWTFRKAPRFFDVVTYTGTGSARTVSHNLGVAPGCIIAKNVSRGTEGWRVYHRSQGATKYAMLQSANAFAAASTVWNNTEPTDSVFTTGSDTGINGTGDTIVAYLFAHDPLGPSGDGSDGLIACGNYTTDASGDASVDLGWEAQWILTKRTDSATGWFLFDTMRGAGVGAGAQLLANTSAAETSVTGPYGAYATASGFDVEFSTYYPNANFIYIAIRRGPMRQPESGTEVFDAYFNSSSVTLGQSTGVTIVPDFVIARDITAATRDFNVADRMRGAGSINPDASFSKKALYTNTTGTEVSDKPFFDIMNTHGNVTVGGEGAGVSGLWGVFLKRAPGFFDVVAYTGDGVAGRTVSHNLGVAPEMMLIKGRSDAADWAVYYGDETKALGLNLTGAAVDGIYFFNDTAPTDSVFTLGIGATVNRNSQTFVAYLFATLPGVSKVGSYTGNGSSQTINCGFTSGARFVLIKRTDSTGDWYVWDTKQGIVAGNDPRLKLNDPGSQITTDDSVDPDSSGFIVNQVAATNINVNAATYIYYAVS